MKECSKSIMRRLTNPNFINRYLRGNGIDIGGSPDPLTLYEEFFPLVTNIKVWDRVDGDAEFMAGVANETFDFVHSSHCLEHLRNPHIGIKNWFRILKPGGYLIVTVPDEDLYEQGVFPSTFNRDHRSTFTIYKAESWSDKSLNVLSMLQGLGSEAAIETVQLITISYRYKVPRMDQTLTPIAECAIEMIVRKRDKGEVARRGRREQAPQPNPALRRHFNQYRDDHTAMRASAAMRPPFRNDEPI
jgi:SAM-dependent methyltransferase